MIPLNSAIEKEFATYLIGQNIPSVGSNIRTMASTGSAELPAVYVGCPQPGSVVGSQWSAVYRVPIVIQVGYNATDYQNDPTILDTLTENVEEALQNAQATINGTVGSKVFLFSLQIKSAPFASVQDNAYLYSIQLEAVAKKIN